MPKCLGLLKRLCCLLVPEHGGRIGMWTWSHLGEFIAKNEPGLHHFLCDWSNYVYKSNYRCVDAKCSTEMKKTGSVFSSAYTTKWTLLWFLPTDQILTSCFLASKYNLSFPIFLQAFFYVSFFPSWCSFPADYGENQAKDLNLKKMLEFWMYLKRGDPYWYTLMDDVVGVLEDWWVENLMNLSNTDDTAFETALDTDEELCPLHNRGWFVRFSFESCEDILKQLSSPFSPFYLMREHIIPLLKVQLCLVFL